MVEVHLEVGNGAWREEFGAGWPLSVEEQGGHDVLIAGGTAVYVVLVVHGSKSSWAEVEKRLLKKFERI